MHVCVKTQWKSRWLQLVKLTGHIIRYTVTSSRYIAVLPFYGFQHTLPSLSFRPETPAALYCDCRLMPAFTGVTCWTKRACPTIPHWLTQSECDRRKVAAATPHPPSPFSQMDPRTHPSGASSSNQLSPAHLRCIVNSLAC